MDIVSDTPPGDAKPEKRLATKASDAPDSFGNSARDASQGLSPSDVALNLIETTVKNSALWPAARAVWKRFMAHEDSMLGPEGATSASLDRREEASCEKNSTIVMNPGLGDKDVSTLKFRASVVRDGKHAFNSMGASPRLGEAVWAVNSGWTIDLKVKQETKSSTEHAPMCTCKTESTEIWILSRPEVFRHA